MQIGKMVFDSANKTEKASRFLGGTLDWAIPISAKDAAIQSGERVETPAFLAARAEIFRESPRVYGPHGAMSKHYH